ncbi:MAG TPA: PilZ domain-containing protein [Thermodesulfovibrionales bacterium]|nr:PilZ domain-containing protein [Thermodesulfovibrionales bacterium]
MADSLTITTQSSYTDRGVPVKKVILAEDLQEVIDREKSFLNRLEIRTLQAATNKKALALHKAGKADLIIAKLDSPDMTGETLCSLIREDERLRNVSIIIVCPESESDIERCIRCRANAFVNLPISSATLLEEARQLLQIAPRTSARIPISVKLRGVSQKTDFIGSIENISTSGMLFQAAAMIFEGDAVKCSFSVGRSASITTDVEIVRNLPKKRRHDPNRYGVRFTNLDAASFSAIDAYVSRQRQKV